MCVYLAHKSALRGVAFQMRIRLFGCRCAVSVLCFAVLEALLLHLGHGGSAGASNSGRIATVIRRQTLTFL